jgi:hypothetical protein
MPSFAQLILAAPMGFISGSKLLNEAVANDETAKDAIVEACTAARGLDHKVCIETSSQKGGDKWQEEVKILTYVVYCFEHATPKPSVQEMASALDSNTFLSRDAITILISAIDTVTSAGGKGKGSGAGAAVDRGAAGAAALEDIRKTSNFGRLRNLQWRLGVALSSSSCDNLSSPYIAISFDVVDPNGNTQTHTTEMAYPAFLRFRTEFQKVNATMSAM